jgi:hypothetical protein
MTTGGSLGGLWSQAGAKPELFLRDQAMVAMVDGAGPPKLVTTPTTPRSGPHPQALRWQAEPKEQAHAVIATPRVAAVAGRIGGRTVTAGPLSVTLQPTPRNFASVALAALDQQPIEQSRKLLLVICGAVGNTGMKWNDTFTSVGRNWGSGPTVVEPLTADIGVNTRVAGLSVSALDPTGTPQAKLAAIQQGGAVRFRVEPGQKTIWYAIHTP